MNENARIEIEEVDAVDAPARARVTPGFERKRDYLAGFLAEKKPEPDPASGALVEAIVEESELDLGTTQLSAVNDQPRKDDEEEDHDVQIVAAQ
jgi:hypothetical protein